MTWISTYTYTQLDILDCLDNKLVMDALSTLVTLVIAVTIFFIIYSISRQVLLKVAKTKKQISNVNLFLNIIKYVFIFFVILIVISAYFGSWVELGITAGLFTAALGWALQKPISGMAAWVMVVVKRPFDIRDRIMVGNTKGDIIDISLTHIHLAEIGGTIEGEEQSGRIIMVPNSLLFEKEIINYTKQNEYILDEITIMVTYESNLKKAEDILQKSVKKVMEPFHPKYPRQIPTGSHTRLNFRESGIDVTVRYHTPAKNRNSLATDIRREIYARIQRSKDVEFAYPHTEVLIKKIMG